MPHKMDLSLDTRIVEESTFSIDDMFPNEKKTNVTQQLADPTKRELIM
jgi:hypothetical protein